MNARDAKAEAYLLLSEWAWDMKTPGACRDYVADDDDAELLAKAFEEVGLSLYGRWAKLHDAPRAEYLP